MYITTVLQLLVIPFVLSAEEPRTLNDPQALKNPPALEDTPALNDTSVLDYPKNSTSLVDAPATENPPASEDKPPSKNTPSSKDTPSLNNSSTSEELLSLEDKPERDLVKPRIFGGDPISVQELGGYAAQIYRQDTFICTGSVLSLFHVLSAAHCFENVYDYGEINVVAGETYRYSYNSERYYVIFALIHPYYQKYDFEGDVAVLKVGNPMQGYGIRPIAICSRLLSAGMIVTVAGWGKSEYGEYDTVLRKIDIPLISKDQCNYEVGFFLPDVAICAAGYNYQTICFGDSGGPLVYDDEVCGISVYTTGCGNNVSPDIYMSVYMYQNFIRGGMSM